MKTLTYGTVPDRESIERACTEPYEIRPCFTDLGALEKVTGYIDSHLEAVKFTQDGRKLFFAPETMHTLIRRLAERWENGDEDAGNLAASILDTLDFEWV